MSHESTPDAAPANTVIDPESFVGQRPATPNDPEYRPPSIDEATIAPGLGEALRHLIDEYGLAGVTSVIDELTGTVAVESGTVELVGSFAPRFVQLPGTSPRQWVNVDRVVAVYVIPANNTCGVVVSTGTPITCDVAASVVVDALNDAGA